MSFHVQQEFQYHQQDQGNYCGDACAEMVLRSDGVVYKAGASDPQDTYPQGALDELIRQYSRQDTALRPAPKWSSAPDGIEGALRDRDPDPSTGARRFSLFADANSPTALETASKRIVQAIYGSNPANSSSANQSAAIALVNNATHWVVVRGFTTSASPQSGSYTITSFDIHDPWPPVPTTSGRVDHEDDDNCKCGTGVVKVHGKDADHGTPLENWSYDAWQGKGRLASDPNPPVPPIFTMVPARQPKTGARSTWSEHFVTICPLLPQSLNVSEEDPDGQVEPHPPDDPTRLDPHLGDKTLPLGAQELKFDTIMGSLNEMGLKDRNDWAPALSRATQTGALLRVQWYDYPESFYYIVPLQAPGGLTVAAVIVDGFTGLYLQAKALPKEVVQHLDNNSVIPLVTEESAKQAVIGKDPFNTGQPLQDSDLTKYDHFVWKSCSASLSAFYPFYLYYVMVDGIKRSLFIRDSDTFFTDVDLRDPDSNLDGYGL